MADHLSFKERLVEGLKEDSALDVNSTIRQHLDSILERKLNQLKEADQQRDVALEITSAAASFGGYDSDSKNGVIAVSFRTRQGAEHFSDYLEDNSCVESYELSASHPSLDATSEDTEVDLDDITNDEGYTFLVIAYLHPEYTIFDDDYDGDGDVDDTDMAYATDAADDEDLDAFAEAVQHEPGEPIEEVMRKIRVSSRGIKSIKMKCSQGFKWDPVIGACIKITGSELAVMRKASRRAIITKRSLGTAFKVRVKRRIKRAFKFRKMMGLKL